eukprot:3905287-Alexandrium_andersonii.AAC.1
MLGQRRTGYRRKAVHRRVRVCARQLHLWHDAARCAGGRAGRPGESEWGEARRERRWPERPGKDPAQ